MWVAAITTFGMSDLSCFFFNEAAASDEMMDAVTESFDLIWLIVLRSNRPSMPGLYLLGLKMILITALMDLISMSSSS